MILKSMPELRAPYSECLQPKPKVSRQLAVGGFSQGCHPFFMGC